jgi:hypothetical protein
MRARFYLAGSFLLLAVTFPTGLQAQFQQPTKEELQMTSDPMAPGAAAVYLNIEENTDDPMHYRTFYARIKVLQEKGKEAATVEIPYLHGEYKVKYIEGRTIHPDGTIIPLATKPEDLLATKSGDLQINRVVFNLPSVEVGSILEYRYEVQYDDDHFSSPYWAIQKKYFVHKAHYAFTPFKAFLKGLQNATSTTLVDAKGNAVNSLTWWPVLPPGTNLVTDTIGRFTLDVANVPPIPDEEWMPPINTLLYHVRFYYESSFGVGDYWTTEAAHWSKDVDRFAEPTKTIRDAVASLVAPTDTDLDKARKLYTAVQALENTDFSRAKGQAEMKQLGLHATKRAEDTWKKKSGSRQDITLLYLAMLRAAGLTAYDMKVVNRDDSLFTPTYLDFDQLDDDVIILSLNGHEVYLDPGEKMCPFLLTHWKHAGATGVRQEATLRSIATTPLLSYKTSSLTRLADITLDEHGTATGTIRLMMAGQDALRWRQASLQSDNAELKKSFDRWLQTMTPNGVDAHVDHFLGMDNPDAILMAVINLHGGLATATSKRLLLPGFFFATRNQHPFVDEAKRIEVVDMHFAETIADQVTYHLPAGFTVEGAPQDASIPWEHEAVLATKTKVEPGQVTESRELLRGFTFVKAEDYPTLRDFYQKMAAVDDQQLVLEATSAAKGN